jgi:antitoxin VapB
MSRLALFRVAMVLRDRLARSLSRSRRRPLREELREIGRRCAAPPTLDNRSEDDILGYDDRELPR